MSNRLKTVERFSELASDLSLMITAYGLGGEFYTYEVSEGVEDFTDKEWYKYLAAERKEEFKEFNDLCYTLPRGYVV